MPYKSPSFLDFIKRGVRQLNQEELEEIFPDVEDRRCPICTEKYFTDPEDDQQSGEDPVLIMHCRCRRAIVGEKCLAEWASADAETAKCLWCKDPLWKDSSGPHNFLNVYRSRRWGDFSLPQARDYRLWSLALDNDPLDDKIMATIISERRAGTGAFTVRPPEFNIVIRSDQMIWAMEKYANGEVGDPELNRDWIDRCVSQEADRSTLIKCLNQLLVDLASWFYDNEGTWWVPSMLENRLCRMVGKSLLPRLWPRVRTAGADFDLISKMIQKALSRTIMWLQWNVWNRENRLATGADPVVTVALRARAESTRVFINRNTTRGLLTQHDIRDILRKLGKDAYALFGELEALERAHKRRGRFREDFRRP